MRLSVQNARSKLVVISGPPGSGKSRLLVELAHEHANEVFVLTDNPRCFKGPFTKLIHVISFDRFEQEIDRLQQLPRGSMLLIDGINGDLHADLDAENRSRYSGTLARLKFLCINWGVWICVTNRVTFDGRPWQWQLHQQYADTDVLISRLNGQCEILVFQKALIGAFQSDSLRGAAEVLQAMFNYSVKGSGPSRILVA